MNRRRRSRAKREHSSDEAVAAWDSKASAIAIDATPSQIAPMLHHRFKVGQEVVAPSGGRDALIPRGPQVIVRLLPLVGRDPQYQVHSTVDGRDRVVMEGQIMLIEERPATAAVQKMAAGKSAPSRARRGRR